MACKLTALGWTSAPRARASSKSADTERRGQRELAHSIRLHTVHRWGGVTQRTHPLHAVCGEVSKEGGTVGERHKVSSKTESPEILRALKREGKPPGFKAQRLGSGPLPAQTGIVLGLASPTPCHHPTLQFHNPITAHALQIPHLSPGMLRAYPC